MSAQAKADKSSKDTNLDIKPIEIDEDKFNKVDLGPFTFPSCIITLGKVASGKTTFLANLIRILEPVFKGNVILFSPTLANDPILDKLIEDDEILEFFDTYSNGTLKSVLETIGETEEDQKYFIIFDDILGSLPRANSRDATFFDKFISTFRHGGSFGAREGQVSMCFCVQYFNSLTPVLRTNATYYALLGAQGSKQLKKLSEELAAATGEDEDDFMRVYQESKQKPYDFLFLDMRKLKAYRNLNQLLYSKNPDS
jgi:energy-coupling factor transporter ATP-binding protein EcfA2